MQAIGNLRVARWRQMKVSLPLCNVSLLKNWVLLFIVPSHGSLRFMFMSMFMYICAFFGLRQTIGRAKCKLKKGNNGLGNEQGILMCRRCCLRMVQFWRHWQCPLLSEVICNKVLWGIMARVNIECCLIHALKGIAKRCC